MSARLAILAAATALLAGCDNMQHQENIRTMQPDPHFANEASERLAPAHTVARDSAPPPEPSVLTAAFLERGRDLFEADCAPCHGADGYGHGIVVRRGFPAPISLHEENQRSLTDQKLFDTITHGTGIMYPFGDRIIPEERWAVVLYVRALQKSQHATLADVAPEGRAALLSP